jgi:hypothetical protein
VKGKFVEECPEIGKVSWLSTHLQKGQKNGAGIAGVRKKML